MPFPYLEAAAVGANTLGSALGLNQQDPVLGNLHLVNPAQQALYGNMAQGLLRGGGDFGLGSGFKQGSSQLAQMMAARGISPQSGAAAGAYGNMVGNAMSNDVQARRQYALSLLGSPLQTATVSGANMVPGSPSQGYSPGAQEGSLNAYNAWGYTTPMVGGYNFSRPGAEAARQQNIYARPRQYR